jgi:hypothetical protein
VLFESDIAHGPPGTSLLYKANDCGAQEVSLCHGHTDFAQLFLHEKRDLSLIPLNGIYNLLKIAIFVLE